MARTCKLCWGTGKIRRDPTEAEAKKMLRRLKGKAPKGGLIVTDLCSCRIGRDIRKNMVRVAREAKSRQNPLPSHVDEAGVIHIHKHPAEGCSGAAPGAANPDMGSPGA